MSQLVFIGEDNLVQLDNVRLASSDALVSNATVTAVLKSEDLVTTIVSSFSVPASATAGQYQGTFSGAGLVLGTNYFLDITISGTLSGFRRVKCRAAYQQE